MSVGVSYYTDSIGAEVYDPSHPFSRESCSQRPAGPGCYPVQDPACSTSGGIGGRNRPDPRSPSNQRQELYPGPRNNTHIDPREPCKAIDLYYRTNTDPRNLHYDNGFSSHIPIGSNNGQLNNEDSRHSTSWSSFNTIISTPSGRCPYGDNSQPLGAYHNSGSGLYKGEQNYDEFPRHSADRNHREGRAQDRFGQQGLRAKRLNEYFVDGESIHREVLQRELRKHLGPAAHSRPGTNKVRLQVFTPVVEFNLLSQSIDGQFMAAVRPFTPVSRTR